MRVLRIAVLIDLELHPHAGGHVKSWLRIAEAAVEHPELDLTLHFIGDDRTEPIAPNVRYRLHRPVLGTRALPFLARAPDHTDLAPLHPTLWRDLIFSDVIHTTSAYFAFARTAMRVAGKLGTPLVTSTHTDVPKYTRVFTEVISKHLERAHLAERMAARMEATLDRHFAACDRVLASSDGDYFRALRVLPPEQVSRLRRGVDRERFHPRFRDRDWLMRAHGIDPESLVLLFVGRIDESKSPLVLAEAAEILKKRGRPIAALFAGRGRQRSDVAALLGERACLGPVVQDDLPRLYASADLLVLPSRTEILPNVVLEAKSSGIPVMVASEGGSRALVEDGVDGFVMESADPTDWADRIEALDRSALAASGRAARASIETGWPSWREVLEQDLIPVWEAVSAPSRTAATREAQGRRARPRALGE